MGSKERRTKAITIFKGGEKKTQKTNPSFLREHTAGSHHVLLGDALYYFVRSFSVQYQTGLLRFLSVFFLFPFGLRAESHFKQWAEQFLGGKNGEKKKKRKRFVLGVLACVLWGSPYHFRGGRRILFSPDRELQCKKESAPLLEFYRQLENKR